MNYWDENFPARATAAIEEWNDLALSAEVAADLLAEEHPRLADIYDDLAEHFRALEATCIEMLELYTEEHGGEA